MCTLTIPFPATVKSYGTLQEEWYGLSPSFIKSLYNSLPRRVKALKDAKGSHTPYCIPNYSYIFHKLEHLILSLLLSRACYEVESPTSSLTCRALNRGTRRDWRLRATCCTAPTEQPYIHVHGGYDVILYSTISYYVVPQPQYLELSLGDW